MNHVSVSPTNGNGPTQGQRKTVTKVRIEPTTTFGWLQRWFFCRRENAAHAKVMDTSYERSDKLKHKCY